MDIIFKSKINLLGLFLIFVMPEGLFLTVGNSAEVKEPFFYNITLENNMFIPINETIVKENVDNFYCFFNDQDKYKCQNCGGRISGCYNPHKCYEFL